MLMNPSHVHKGKIGLINNIKSELITEFKELESLCIAMECMEAFGKKF